MSKTLKRKGWTQINRQKPQKEINSYPEFLRDILKRVSVLLRRLSPRLLRSRLILLPKTMPKSQTTQEVESVIIHVNAIDTKKLKRTIMFLL